jgi:hypothetical protein
MTATSSENRLLKEQGFPNPMNSYFSKSTPIIDNHGGTMLQEQRYHFHAQYPVAL